MANKFNKKRRAVKASLNSKKRAVMAMQLTRDFFEFQPWSGAVDTWNTLHDYDKLDELEAILDTTYIDSEGNGIMSETELNDLLWFEPETVYEWVGLYYDPETGEVSDEPFEVEEEEDFYEDEKIEESVKAKRRKPVKAAKNRSRISASKRRKGAKVMASSNDPVTTNLADFPKRKLEEARDLLDAMFRSGLPKDFYNEGITIALNRNSGYVFLTNDDYQVAMVDDNGKLYSWYFTPYYGHEGSYEDLLADALYGDWDDDVSDDYEYLKDLAENVYDDAESAEKLQEIIDRINGGDDDEEE